MIFTQLEFILFAILLLTLLALIPHNRTQKIILLLCSYYCYGYWDYRFTFLLAAVTTLHYTAGILLEKLDSKHQRKIILIITVIISLGTLAVFKYFNFFMDSLNVALKPLGWNIQSFDWILPLGISFFTFQTIAYTSDVYMGKIKACHDLADFALFTAFFPVQLSGPILRAGDFLPQLATSRKLNGEQIYNGFRQFVFGLFKKVFIADHLALFVNECFANHAVYNGWTLWLAVFAYTLQIYCDFSGYSDMAIGIGRIMGFDLGVNFNHPYLSKNVTEFWRRWHISLSLWLRDYLYIPLGGNRHGRFRTYLNLFLTMLLGGLWHGAAWTFVFWGAWHGGALCIHKYFKEKTNGRFSMPTIAAVTITFLCVMIGWIFFRASSFSQAFAILHGMFSFAAGISYYDPFVLCISIGFLIYYIVLGYNELYFSKLNCFSIFSATLLILMIYLVIVFQPEEFQPFIYFKF